MLDNSEQKDNETGNNAKDGSNNIKQHKKNSANKKSNKKQNSRKNNVHSRLKGGTMVNQQQSQVCLWLIFVFK